MHHLRVGQYTGYNREYLKSLRGSILTVEQTSSKKKSTENKKKSMKKQKAENKKKEKKEGSKGKDYQEEKVFPL